jgi:hypothetical protein
VSRSAAKSASTQPRSLPARYCKQYSAAYKRLYNEFLTPEWCEVVNGGGKRTTPTARLAHQKTRSGGLLPLAGAAQGEKATAAGGANSNMW